MSTALTKSSDSNNVRGALSAAASGVLPGLGQLLNGEGEKGLGVFAVATVAGLGFWSSIPLLGSAAGVIAGGTWIYGVVDGFFKGRKKK